MLMKRCPKCGKVITIDQKYCDKHQVRDNRDYDKNRRNKKSKKFYNSAEWKILSKRVMSINNYKCADCGGIATEVHHIIPITVDWGKRLDINNLMPLCARCHNGKRK